VRTITSSQTYIETPGTQSVIVKIVGAGAGTDAAPATATGQVSIVSGGGAGAYAEGKFTSGFNGAMVLIGAAGTAGVSGSPTGANGGTTSFGSLMSAPGGIKGSAAGPAAPPFTPQGNSISSTPAGGNIMQFAGAGSPSAAYANSLASYLGSPGANSPFGVGGQVPSSGVSGNLANGYGAAGSGPCQGPSGGVVHGGTGVGGVCVVYEYA
jgi:hypothetical protein